MNTNETIDTSIEVIENFYILTGTPAKFNIIKNLLQIIEEFETDTDIETAITEIILSKEVEDEISYEINSILFDSVRDILLSKGITVNMNTITLKIFLYILIVLVEVPKYDEVKYDEIMSIFTSEEENIIKLDQLLNLYNTNNELLYDYVDDVSDNFLLNLEKQLEFNKELSTNTDPEYVDFIKRITILYRPLLKSLLVRKMVETEDYRLVFNDYISVVYDFIKNNYAFNIEKSALEIVAILVLSIDIENIHYLLDGEIRDDMIELGYNIDIINQIIERVKEILGKDVKYDQDRIF